MGLSIAFLLALAAPLQAAWNFKKPAENSLAPEEQLIDWVKENGGEVGYTVGRECADCLRGAIATKDYDPQEIIVKVPFNVTIRMKKFDYNAFAAEHAYFFLQEMHTDPAFNSTYRLFLAAHPGPEEVLSPESYKDSWFDMLQTPNLAQLMRSHRKVSDSVYTGYYAYRDYKPLNQTVPVSLDTFRYFSSLLASRYFGFYRDGKFDQMVNHLVPVADMVNHDNDPNAERYDDGEFVILRATRAIKKGEAVTNSYQPGVVHRPDMSLFIYGFVVPSDTPLLCAADRHDMDWKNPYQNTPPDDSIYDDPASPYVSLQEYNRLNSLLSQMPTSEEEDAQLLRQVTDWREAVLVQFRMQRKRALRQTMDRVRQKIEAMLGDAFDPGASTSVGLEIQYPINAEEEEKDEYAVEEETEEVTYRFKMPMDGEDGPMDLSGIEGLLDPEQLGELLQGMEQWDGEGEGDWEEGDMQLGGGQGEEEEGYDQGPAGGEGDSGGHGSDYSEERREEL